MLAPSSARQALREADECKEGKMARIDGESANELFNTLAGWNAQLEARAASPAHEIRASGVPAVLSWPYGPPIRALR